MEHHNQDDAAAKETGISCPKCGCRHCPRAPHEVERTITLGQNRSIRRVRVCRYCRHRFVTTERVAGVPFNDHGDVIPIRDERQFSRQSSASYQPRREIG